MVQSVSMPMLVAIERLHAAEASTWKLWVDYDHRPCEAAVVHAVAELLLMASAPKHLDLQDAAITDAGAQVLGTALRSNSSVRELNLSGNRLGVAGVQALAELLLANTTLQRLYLWGNRFGDDGAALLAASLDSNSTLQTLDLQFAPISDRGVAALAGALMGNAVLRQLSLAGNLISDISARLLAQSLMVNTTLELLHLEGNCIRASGARDDVESGLLLEALARAISIHPKVDVLLFPAAFGSELDAEVTDNWKRLVEVRAAERARNATPNT